MKKILIVDDESGFTRLIKLTLEKTGDYQVLEVNDGMQAWNIAREFRPDLILLDIVMPKIEGDPLLKDARIVFLTAIVSEKETVPGGLIGGFPFISKPVSLDTLVRTIEENLAPTA